MAMAFDSGVYPFKFPIENPNMWVDVAYILAAALFILAIIGLGQQKSAKLGNAAGTLGMLVCCVSLYVYESYKYKMNNWQELIGSDYFGWGDTTKRGWYIIPIFYCVGALVGIIFAATVQMTQMPALVGFFNALGGFAATLAGIAYYVSSFAYYYAPSKGDSRLQMLFLLLSIVVGIITFVGSLVAAVKVNSNANIYFPFILNIIIMIIIVALIVLTGLGGYPIAPGKGIFDLLPSIAELNRPESQWTCFGLLLFFSAIYGITFVIPIGGADMPVVIAVLNAFSGLSGCFAGFLAQNKLLIITGTIVASSGCILSYIMCRAMNRSLLNVLVGGSSKKTQTEQGEVNDGHPIDASGVYNLLLGAKNIMIVPGYGMAIAKAQGDVATFVDHCVKASKNVKFGIHPVAGRLPGHMNVLLAEASVPYDLVYSMDEVNPIMKSVDVCIIVGANDTVNPSAVDDPSCDIYGMPVIHAWEAKTVVVMKRSLQSKGYADVFNPLFFRNNSRFFAGDANSSVGKINSIISQNQHEFYHSESGVSSSAANTNTVPIDYANCPRHKTIGVPKESGLLQERRIALSPECCGNLRKLGFDIMIESKAGILSNFSNTMYKKYGCRIVQSKNEVFTADIVVKINEPTDREVELLKQGQVLISYGDPDNKKDLLDAVSRRGVTWIAMDKVPRTTVAQKFDSLSSAGKISGYRAVVESLYYYQGFMTQQITAWGKYPNARVFILGGGVAGLEAIGVFKMLGAEVYCFDVRPIARTDIESAGAKFVEFNIDASGSGGYARPLTEKEIQQEQQIIKDRAVQCDIVICTAALPGRRAPLLLTREAVESMRPGSVIVDLSARTGGNCEVTRNGGVYVTANGVTVCGMLNLPSQMPRISSEFYAGNIVELLKHMSGKDGNAQEFKTDFNDATLNAMIATNGGQVVYKPYQPPTQNKPKAAPKAQIAPKEESSTCCVILSIFMCLCFIVLLVMTILYFPRQYYELWMIFTLSCFIGYLSVWGVSPSLHTPLMSVTNAISGVVVLSAIPLIHEPEKSAPLWLGMCAVFFAAINIGGGFFVTHRMLAMFILKSEKKISLKSTPPTQPPAKPVQPPVVPSEKVQPVQPVQPQQPPAQPVQPIQVPSNNVPRPQSNQNMPPAQSPYNQQPPVSNTPINRSQINNSQTPRGVPPAPQNGPIGGSTFDSLNKPDQIPINVSSGTPINSSRGSQPQGQPLPQGQPRAGPSTGRPAARPRVRARQAAPQVAPQVAPQGSAPAQGARPKVTTRSRPPRK